MFLYAPEKGPYKFHKTQRSENTKYKDREVSKTQKAEVKIMAEEIKNNVTDNQQDSTKQDNQQDNTKPEEKNEPEVTVESLMARVAELEAKEAKTKAALDTALKEKGEITKQYRATLTEAQQAKLDKETADEEYKAYVAGLEAYQKKNEAMKRYMTVQKMPADLAEKAADAEIAGDMDSLTAIQNQHSESKLKEARADWQKSIPQPQFGTGEYSSMTKEEIMAIKDDEERVKAIAQNQHLFKTN